MTDLPITADPKSGKTTYVIFDCVANENEWYEVEERIEAANADQAIQKHWSSLAVSAEDDYVPLLTVAFPVRSYKPQKPVVDPTPRWRKA